MHTESTAAREAAARTPLLREGRLYISFTAAWYQQRPVWWTAIDMANMSREQGYVDALGY